MGYSIAANIICCFICNRRRFKYAIEEQLGYLEPHIIFNDLIYKKATDTLIKDLGVQPSTPPITLILIYVDFGDLYQILNSHRAEIPISVAEDVKGITPKLERLVLLEIE